MPPSPSLITLRVAGRTDRGRTRATNEDALLLSDLSGPPLGGVAPTACFDVAGGSALVVVSDGVGGTNAGEVASDMVVNLVADAFSNVGSVEPARIPGLIASVNHTIWEASREPARHGMGATMTALYFVGDAVFLMQVGDSRAYLLREGRLLQLTRDQTRVQMLVDSGALTPEEASRAPDRNVILQAMGRAPHVELALLRLDLRQDDRLLVCSDGLSNKLSHRALSEALGRDQPFEAIAETLVAEANARGGEDNITAVVCGVRGPALRDPRGSGPRSDLHPVGDGRAKTMLPPRPTELSEGATDATFERFLTESRERSHRGDYARSLEAARRAVARARDLRSTELSVRAAEREANTLSLSGCGREAAERLGSILSLVNERPRSLRLTDRRVAHAVVCAHLDWVSITGFIDPVPVQRRFEVLDRTEALLMEMGRPDWRSGVLGMRATLLRSLCRYEEAIPLSAHAIRTFSEGAPGSTLASYRQQHADTLFDARRISEAEIEYRAIVTDARRSVRDEKSAHVGLARCALRRGELAVARQHAEEAVRIAKPLSDSALCGALHVLAEVLEKSDELDHAVAVADQLVEKARKTKSPQRLFFAIRSQIDIALAREDGESARSWLEGAERLASLLDGKGGSGYAAQLRGRRERIDSESV